MGVVTRDLIVVREPRTQPELVELESWILVRLEGLLVIPRIDMQTVLRHPAQPVKTAESVTGQLENVFVLQVTRGTLVPTLPAILLVALEGSARPSTPAPVTRACRLIRRNLEANAMCAIPHA